MLDLVVVLLIGLALFGPKALQSMARSAGKGVREAKAMKDKVIAELPVEEISEVSRHLSRVPMSPQQAVHMLITQEATEKSTEKEKAQKSQPQ
jgi:TatA/E family protein of Tat protein translocase